MFQSRPINNENTEQKILGAFIRYHREQENISTNFLSQIANVSKSYLSDIEHGKKKPSEYAIHQITKALDINFHNEKEVYEKTNASISQIYQELIYYNYSDAKKLCEDILCNFDYLENSLAFIQINLIKFVYILMFKFQEEKSELESVQKILEQFISLLDNECKAMFYLMDSIYYLKINDAELALCCLEKGKTLSKSLLIEAMYTFHMMKYYQIIGDLYQTLHYCDKAKRQFTDLYLYKRILHIGIQEAIIYAKNFKYSIAEQRFKELLKVSLSEPNEFTKVILDDLSWLNLSMGNYEKCIFYADESMKYSMSNFTEVLLYKPLAYFCLEEYDKCKDEILLLRMSEYIDSKKKILLEALLNYCYHNYEIFEKNMIEYVGLIEDRLEKDMTLLLNEQLYKYYIKHANTAKGLKVLEKNYFLLKEIKN